MPVGKNKKVTSKFQKIRSERRNRNVEVNITEKQESSVNIQVFSISPLTFFSHTGRSTPVV